jgi:hypothetical protein
MPRPPRVWFGAAGTNWPIKGGISLIGYSGRGSGRGYRKPTQIPIRNAKGMQAR